ncbi:hypothetical protein Tco_0381900, partial [Tanacetum coccineum]
MAYQPFHINTAYSVQQIHMAYSNLLNTVYRSSDTAAKQVIREGSKKLGLLKINDDSFTCDTPLGIIFDEFNRLSGMDDDLFTYENDGIYDEAVIFVNKRLVRLMDVIVEQWLDLMYESAKRHEENSNIIKEIRASTDAAIRNQGALIKTLEIRIGQMSKNQDWQYVQQQDSMIDYRFKIPKPLLEDKKRKKEQYDDLAETMI